jgi:hypothetical protein
MIDFSKLPEDQLKIAEKIVAEATRQGVDPNLALAIAGAETGGKFNHANDKGVIRSGKGALGIMQIMPATAELYRKRDKIDINPNDLDSNIRGGVYIIGDLLKTYGTPLNAVVAYNSSSSVRKKFFDTKDLSTLPDETFDYIGKINSMYPLEPVVEGQVDPNKFVPVGDRIVPSSDGSTPQQAATTQQEPPPQQQDSNLMAGIAGGLAGGTLGLATKMLAPAPTRPTTAGFDRASEAMAKAVDRLRIAQSAFSSGIVPQDLAMQEMQAARNEIASIKQSLGNLPSQPAPSPAPSALDESFRAKRAGGSGAENYLRKMSSAQLPDVVYGAAEDMRKANPRSQGAYQLLEKDLVAQENIRRMGITNQRLVGSGPGQLSLPADVASSVESRMAAQRASEAAQEAGRLQQIEAQRSALQQQQQIANARAQAAAQQLKESRSATTGVDRASSKVAEAEAALARAAEAKPSLASRIGYQIATNPVLAKSLAGVGGAMSLHDAKMRANQGDYLGAGLSGLEAGFAGLSVAPFLPAKAVGALGGLGMAAGRYLGENFGADTLERLFPLNTGLPR